MIDAGTILEVTRNLIGATEPYGDSGIDRERTENVDKLIYVIDELLYDLEKVAVNKDRHEGSMRMMGEKANKALEDIWSWINAYLEEEQPTVDAVPVVHGRWIYTPTEQLGYKCSVCGKGCCRFNYCPNCGADMRGEQDD